MSETKTYVVEGAAQAGWQAMQTLLAQDRAGHTVLIGDEPCVPSQRPMLSNRGDVAALKFFAIYLDDGIVVGMNAVSSAKEAASTSGFIVQRLQPDTATPLKSLVAA